MAKSHVRAPVLWQTDHALARLAEILGIPTAHAYGVVVALTGHLMERHKHGRLRDVPSPEIESAVGWEGEPGALASALLDNYVDGRGVLRDWEETAAPILREREANNARVKQFRERQREAQGKRADEWVRRQSQEITVSSEDLPHPGIVVDHGDGNVYRHMPPKGTKGAGGNGSTSLNSASPSDVIANSHRAPPAPPPSRPNNGTPPADRTAPGVRQSRENTAVTRDTSSHRDVTRDAPGSPQPSPEPPTSSGYPHQSTSSDVGSVMRDSNALQSHVENCVENSVTRYAPLARAAFKDLDLKDLDQKQELDQEQRSVRTDGTGTATISLEQANLGAKIIALIATILGVPVERFAGRDVFEISTGRDEAAKSALATVTRFLHKYYPDTQRELVVGIVNEMILTMTPEGVRSPSGARVASVRGESLVYALQETLTRPPKQPGSAWPYTLRKLESGRANLELGPDGQTLTERLSERGRAVDRQIAPAIRATIDSLTGSWAGRKTVTTKADEQRTALRWIKGEPLVRQEIAEACEQNFRSWDQSLPGLDDVKDNWVKAEALRRWRAADRPLPMPPR